MKKRAADAVPQHRITLPLPESVWAAVDALAQTHQRSFTQELVWALREYVQRETGCDTDNGRGIAQPS